MATERLSSHNIHLRRSEQQASGIKNLLRNPNFLVPAIAATFTLGDLASTQIVFNVTHTDASQSEANFLSSLAMHGGSSVFTPEIAVLSAARVAFTAIPFWALNHVADQNKKHKDSLAYAAPKGIAYAWAIGTILSSTFANVNNAWNAFHAEGMLPVPPWTDAVRYYIADGHMFDLPLEGLMRYWDLADYTGLGLGNFTLLNAGVAALATAGAIFARKQYKRSHQGD